MPSIRVRTAARAAFWRAGRQFGPAPVVVDVAELSDEQLAAVRAEPRLVVEDVSEGAPKPEAGKPAVAPRPKAEAKPKASKPAAAPKATP